MNNYFSMDFFSQICLSGTVLSSVVYQVTAVRMILLYYKNNFFLITKKNSL